MDPNIENQEVDVQVDEQATQQTENQETTSVKPPDPEKLRRALADNDDDFNDVQIDEPERRESVENDESSSDQGEKVPTENAKPADTEKTETPKYNPLWDQIKAEYEEQLGEGTFKMPEITPENESKLLLDFLQENLERQSDTSNLPPELQEQLELHKQGKYDPHSYFQSKSPSNDVLNLPNKDFLRAIYKARNGKSETNPDGWDDSEINDFLESKSRIEIDEMAVTAKQQTKSAREEREIKQRELSEKKQAEEFESIKKTTLNMAKDVVNRHKQDNDYFGIELTPEEKAEYDNKVFPDMVALDDKTRTNTLGKLLQDDNLLYKLGAIVWKRDALKGYISDIKEKVKEETENKLDPKLDQAGGSIKLTKLVDRSKLV